MSTDPPDDRGDPPEGKAEGGVPPPPPGVHPPDEISYLVRRLMIYIPALREGPLPDSNLTGAGREDVDEDEAPKSLDVPSVIRKGDELDPQLMKERTTSRLAYTLLGLLIGLTAVTVVAIFRLPADDAVAKLMDLSNNLLVIVAGALGYYFGNRKSGD
ncbi:hypothetical protein OHB24_14605 [Kribbella sp. NBC_00482]|uniref:hypothetical protein n=1 Tax=Kribbella sp. NBC_00482 TaxID=2975968 RepID=UPI002E1910F7